MKIDQLEGSVQTYRELYYRLESILNRLAPTDEQESKSCIQDSNEGELGRLNRAIDSIGYTASKIDDTITKLSSLV